MLEKPDLPDQLIISGLANEFGLYASDVSFLPLGADVNSAAYRVAAEDGSAYFLKVRSGAFDKMSVAVPQFLKAQGIREVIAPLKTKKGDLWGHLSVYKMILYPFIQGMNGYETALSDDHWVSLGAALKKIHTVQMPPALLQIVQREDYSPRWRDMVKAFQEQVETAAFADPPAAKIAAFMQTRQAEISHLVARAGQLANTLQRRSLGFVLCHSDIHAGNLLIGVDGVAHSASAQGAGAINAGAHGALYIVDWDNPILAPKERDLMFAGAGIGSGWQGKREEGLFYQGYGQAEVDQTALAYYRCERIVQDIAAFCEQLFTTDEGGEDREQAVEYFIGQFLPGQEVDVAFKTDELRGSDNS